jgi:flagellin-like hook-associated protein FlgL
MSGIVLSAATRSNLLSAQDTAELLATTQTRLATGKKVNSALDSPVNFFTAAGLDARASDIMNVLDSISNGVQVLQAANTGITSLQKLIDSAKSVANQALQTSIGYSTKSNVSTTIVGATAADLRGTSSYSAKTAVGNVVADAAAAAVTGATVLGGKSGAVTGSAVSDNSGSPAPITADTTLNGSSGALDAAAFSSGDTMTVNGKTITFLSGAAPTATNGLSAPAGYTMVGNIATDGNGNSTVYLGVTNTTATVGDVLTAVDLASGVKSLNGTTITTNAGQTASSIASGEITLQTPTSGGLTISTNKTGLGTVLGLTAISDTANTPVVTPVGTAAAGYLATSISDGSTLTVDGKTITFKNAIAPNETGVQTGTGVLQNSSGHNTGVVVDGNGNSTVYLQSSTMQDVLDAIDLATGVKSSTVSNGKASAVALTAGQSAATVSATGALQISTGTLADLSITGTGNALVALGLGSTTNASFTASRVAGIGNLSGKTLSFGAFAGGTAVDITFGDGKNGTVKTLDQLNNALAANNLVATIDATGKLTVSASNDHASATIGSTADGGAVGGTAVGIFSAASAPVEDANSQNTRKALINQFNTILQQINTTSQDASYNGINLLGGDTLKLVFNETGKSTISITGVTFDASGLGLVNLGQNGANEFKDNASTNRVLTSLTAAATLLRSQASTFGSNLSVVQTRQTFNKSLINVLQTGSANLTNADLNEEAANSQALNTRQSLAVSALSLANQAQQSVLQLLK